MNNKFLPKRIKIFIPVLFFSLLLSCAKEVSVSPDDLPVGTGFIRLESSPSGAKIYMNGTNTGKVTPDSIRFLYEGEYKILLRLAGWKDTLLTVNVTNGEKENLFVNFKVNPSMYGAIKLTSYPTGASIILDDSATGQITPAILYSLLPGTYNIVLRKAGCEDDKFEVEVKSQIITEVDRVLPDTTCWVTYRTSNTAIPSNSVLSIAIDNENVKWIGTDGKGVAVLKGNEWTVYNKINSPLPDNRVQIVFVDNQNNKWFGTTNYGLVKFDGTQWTIYNTANSEIPSDNIISITQDQDNSFWIGTYDKGVVNIKDNVFTIYNTSSGLPGNNVTSILVSKTNEIWVSTYLDGIAVYKNNTWTIYNEENSGINKMINTLGMDNDGVIYAGTIEFGVAKFVDGSWEYITPTFAKNILTIVADKKNHIWVGSNDNGFSVLNSSIYIYRDVFNADTSPIEVNSINYIAVDRYNYKWICTEGGGLIKYKGKL